MLLIFKPLYSEDLPVYLTSNLVTFVSPVFILFSLVLVSFCKSN